MDHPSEIASSCPDPNASTGNCAESARGDAAIDLTLVITTYQTRLLRYAQRFVRNPESAQDVVQEVFIRLINEPPRQGWGESPECYERFLSNWLYRVTHNLCIDLIRKESRMRAQHERIEPPEPAPPASRALEAADSHERVNQLLRRLSENQRTVLILRVYEGKSYREISEITGMSVSNVGFHIYQALKKSAALLRGKE